MSWPSGDEMIWSASAALKSECNELVAALSCWPFPSEEHYGDGRDLYSYSYHEQHSGQCSIAGTGESSKICVSTRPDLSKGDTVAEAVVGTRTAFSICHLSVS